MKSNNKKEITSFVKPLIDDGARLRKEKFNFIKSSILNRAAVINQ